MSDSMYDKLGDLLNEALESECIPQKKNINDIDSEEQKIDVNSNGCDNSGNPGDDSTRFSFNQKKILIFKKKKIAHGQVIKAEELINENLFPSEITQALKILEITDYSNLSKRAIGKAYHNLIKKLHPDLTKNSNILAESENATEKISKINEAYKLLKDYF